MTYAEPVHWHRNREPNVSSVLKLTHNTDPGESDALVLSFSFAAAQLGQEFRQYLRLETRAFAHSIGAALASESR